MQNEITELRNQVRTLKRIVYGFGCLLVAGVVVSATSLQTVPEQIVAKGFHVANEDGEIVASLDSTNGQGTFTLNHHKTGKMIVKLWQNSGGSAELTISNMDGLDIVKFGSEPTGKKGMIEICNESGEVVVRSCPGRTGGGGITFSDEGGNMISGIAAYAKGGGGTMVIVDQNGKMVRYP